MKKNWLLKQTINQNIGMELVIEKCALLIMRNRKRQIMEGIELRNQEIIRAHGEKENYKYSGILEADTIKQVEMKEKNKRAFQTNEKTFWKQAQ